VDKIRAWLNVTEVEGKLHKDKHIFISTFLWMLLRRTTYPSDFV